MSTYQHIACPVPGGSAYRRGDLTIITSRDQGRWHLSIAHPRRYPTWTEIKAARYALLPNTVFMAQLLPPPGQYVNRHPNCFHLWEIFPDRRWSDRLVIEGPL